MVSEAVIEELRIKHRRVRHVVCGEIEAVFRAPTSVEYKRFRAQSHNPAQIASAQEDLARATVVHPSREDFSRVLDEYPGFCENPDVSKAFAELTGMAADEHAKPSGSSSKPSGSSPTSSDKG